MISSLLEFAPDGTESGVGLALQDEQGRYLFFLAGTRYNLPVSEVFYGGIGGHREPGEDWLACAHREAIEEISTDVDILPSSVTWYVSRDGRVEQIAVVERPKPYVLYEMTYPDGMRGVGELYRIVIYRARLKGALGSLPEDELQGVIALTKEQVIEGPERRATLAALLAEGAMMVAGGGSLSPSVRLYPVGTADALARILRHLGT